jgi:hypothetical protein
MKYSSQVRVKMVFMLCPGLSSHQFLKPIGLSAFLLLLIYGTVNKVILPLVFFNC